MRKFRIVSFKYAFSGLVIALKEEPNLGIQALIGFAGLLLALYFKINQIEWLFSVIAFGLVFAAELINTAIEEVVNSFTEQMHPAAKKAKDISAAAVFVLFVTEAIVGLIIFLPYLSKALSFA